MQLVHEVDEEDDEPTGLLNDREGNGDAENNDDDDDGVETVS